MRVVCRGSFQQAQGKYYYANPDLRDKKYLSPLNWTKTMISALCDMSLTMWKNRCDSMYGRTKEEKEQKRRDKLRAQIERCFSNQRSIPVQYHRMFQVSIDILCNKRSSYYLMKWIETFKAHQIQGVQNYFGDEIIEDTENDTSEGTFDTPYIDTDEYLVDITEGMDVEGSLAPAGQPQKSLTPKPPW